MQIWCTTLQYQTPKEAEIIAVEAKAVLICTSLSFHVKYLDKLAQESQPEQLPDGRINLLLKQMLCAEAI